VQFGLPGDPALLKKYHEQGNLIDDPPWLPLGPTGREINGASFVHVCRFMRVNSLLQPPVPLFPRLFCSWNMLVFLVCNHNVFTHSGTARFQKGYLAYAGAGKNSRGTQLIMSFQDNLYLGGGSPWEVPFAQVFGASSFETLGTCCSTLRLVRVE
jgi:hypothetical protein